MDDGYSGTRMPNHHLEHVSLEVTKESFLRDMQLSQQQHDDVLPFSFQSSDDHWSCSVSTTDKSKGISHNHNDDTSVDSKARKIMMLKNCTCCSSLIRASNQSKDEKAVQVSFAAACLLCLAIILAAITANRQGVRAAATLDSFTYTPEDVPATLILESNERLAPGQIMNSPNGEFAFFMTANGGLVLQRTSDGEVVWQVPDNGSERCYMQRDGNLICRSPNRSSAWRTKTGGNDGAYCILDDLGQISVVRQHDAFPVWIAGVPRGQYSPSIPKRNLAFPVRGAFYYPWYPDTWDAVFYHPSLGKYRTGNPAVQHAHVDALQYSHTNLAIASWFGIHSHLDPARITSLLRMSEGTDVLWSVYHEDEKTLDQSPQELRADLEYIKKWYTWHENWAHVEDKPVIFVYNDGSCDVSERWEAATQGQWHVVLKHFGDYDECSVQPNHWHEYGPAKAVVHKPGLSFSISPGFWNAKEENPRLERLSGANWNANIQSMVESEEPWQLITTFNEWGEGTAVESAEEWSSSTGYGFYLDGLHQIHGPTR